MQLSLEAFKSTLIDHIPNLQSDLLLPGACFADCGIDSLMAFEIAMTVEDAYGVHIPDDELAKFNTVEDVWNFTVGNMRS